MKGDSFLWLSPCLKRARDIPASVRIPLQSRQSLLLQIKGGKVLSLEGSSYYHLGSKVVNRSGGPFGRERRILVEKGK